MCTLKVSLIQIKVVVYYLYCFLQTAFGDPPSDNHSAGHHRPGPLKGSSKTTGQPPNLPNSDFVTVDQSETEYEEGELDVIDMTSILANAPGK